MPETSYAFDLHDLLTISDSLRHLSRESSSLAERRHATELEERFNGLIVRMQMGEGGSITLTYGVRKAESARENSSSADGEEKPSDDIEDALRQLERAEEVLEDVKSALEDFRSVLTAPPDPKPRHRSNLLGWRYSEVEGSMWTLQGVMTGLGSYVIALRRALAGDAHQSSGIEEALEDQRTRMRPDGRRFTGGN